MKRGGLPVSPNPRGGKERRWVPGANSASAPSGVGALPSSRHRLWLKRPVDALFSRILRPRLADLRVAVASVVLGVGIAQGAEEPRDPELRRAQMLFRLVNSTPDDFALAEG